MGLINKEEKVVKKSIKKILSSVLASAMVVSVLAVPVSADPVGWSMGVDKTEIAKITVSQANNHFEQTVPVKVFNNTNTENYTVYVEYNPAELELVNATQGDFSMSSADLMANSVNHVPAADNEFFADGKFENGTAPDGVKTEAQLGRVKFAYSAAVAGTAAKTDAEFTAFNLTFRVVDTNVNVGDRYHVAFKYDNAVLYADDNTTNSTNVSNGYIEVIATQGGGGGGGGGGGSYRPTTTTTEAITEVSEPTTKKPDVVIDNPDNPDNPVHINPPTERDPGKGNFTDIDDYPWAKDSIQKLAELGIISGVGDGLFGPGLPCKRCDFAILINRALGVDCEITKNFTDNVDQSKYYYTDCAMGYSAGILSGYGDNNYKPENYCTREEMFVLTAKTLEYLGEDVTSTSLDVNNKYSDVADISWWSAPYCAFLTDNGIVNGNTDGTVNPDAYITRAEMAVMIDKDYTYALEVLDKMMKSAEQANQEILDEHAYGDTTHVDDNGQTLVVTQDLLVEMSAKLTEYVNTVSADAEKLTGDDKAEFDEAVKSSEEIAAKVLTTIAEDELDDVNSDILGAATRIYELATNNKFTVDYQTGFDELKEIAAKGVQKN